MPIALAQAVVGAVGQPTGGAFGVTLGATPTAGNLLVACAGTRGGGLPSPPGGWTTVVSDASAGFGVGPGAIAIRVVDGDGAAVTWTGFGDAASLAVGEYSPGMGRIWDATAFDAGSSSGILSTPNPTFVAIAPDAGVERLLVGSGSYWDDPATITWPIGLTQRFNGSTGGSLWRGFAYADRVVDPTSGTYNSALATNRNTSWMVQLAAFGTVEPPPTAGGGTFGEPGGGVWARALPDELRRRLWPGWTRRRSGLWAPA